MEQFLGFLGLAVLAAALVISFWKRQKKKSLRPATPAGGVTGCESAPGPHCGQCPLGQVDENSK